MNNNKNTKNSTAILLANLKAQFQTDLTSYKQAVADYMAVLQEDSSPFILIGVGTDGNLYSKKGLDESKTWQLINDNSDGNVRSICTGIDGHTIYCTNINNDISYKTSWDAPTWAYYSHNLGKYKGVAACPDGTLLCVGMDNILYQVRSDGSYTPVNRVSTTTDMNFVGNGCCRFNGWQAKSMGSVTEDSCKKSCLDDSTCVAADMARPNSSNQYDCYNFSETIAGGVSTLAAECDTTTPTSKCFKKGTTSVSADGESEVSVAVAPDGSVFVVGGNAEVYKKNSYQNLQNQTWQYQSGGCCIIAMTIAPDGTFIGIGTNNYIYTKDSYKDLSPAWKTYYTAGCCVIGVTTVSNNSKLVSTRSQTYWGSGQAGSQGVYTNVTTADDCAALCSSTTGCSGATFNPIDHGQPMCWLRSGDSDIGPGLYNDYSIVPETKKYLEIMKSINAKLNDTNQQIMDLTNRSEREFDGLSNRTSNNQTELIKNYKVLEQERMKIDEMLKKYEDLDEYQVETELRTNQNYYSFILLSIVTVAIGFMLYFFFSAPSKPTSILPTIQQGGKKKAGVLFFAVILIIIVISFIKLRNKFN